MHPTFDLDCVTQHLLSTLENSLINFTVGQSGEFLSMALRKRRKNSRKGVSPKIIWWYILQLCLSWLTLNATIGCSSLNNQKRRRNQQLKNSKTTERDNSSDYLEKEENLDGYKKTWFTLKSWLIVKNSAAEEPAAKEPVMEEPGTKELMADEVGGWD